LELDLEQQISALLGNFTKLTPRIKHLTFNTDKCGDRIKVRCSYISFRDGQQTLDDFINTLADHIIPFCLPRSEIRAAQKELAQGDHVTAGRVMMQLSEKARALFIKAKKGSHRSGEAGEIVLYILTEWLLQAPQIVSKMYHKTNNQMPVHGTDGHAKREIEIVATYLDFDSIDKDSKEAFLRYLDPYAEESNERVVTHSVLLVFEFSLPSGTEPEDAEQQFTKLTRDLVEDFITSIKKTVDDKGLSPQRFEFFLLPVPSVQDFRDKFQEKIGWPK